MYSFFYLKQKIQIIFQNIFFLPKKKKNKKKKVYKIYELKFRVYTSSAIHYTFSYISIYLEIEISS